MTYIAWLIIAAILLLPGIAISILPVPGILYMLAVACIFGFFDHFAHLSGFDIGVLAVLAAVTLLVDFLAGIVGAKWGGAHWSSVIWGIVGLLAGSVVIPIPFLGSILGMILGVLGSELYRTNDMRAAQKAAAGSFMGWLAGTGFKVCAAVVFVILFVVLAVV